MELQSVKSYLCGSNQWWWWMDGDGEGERSRSTADLVSYLALEDNDNYHDVVYSARHT